VKKVIFLTIIILSAAFASSSFAQENIELTENYDMLLEEYVIGSWETLDNQVKLREYDKLALKVFEENDRAANVPPPFASPQGYVMFPYGAVIPRINCRPYRVSDIVLEPGEEILGIHAGDTVRWLFSPSVSMQNNLKVSHIVVKPSMPNISTNLTIHTDRRAYQLVLISTETESFTPGIAFTYPNTDLNTTFGAYQTRAIVADRTNQGDHIRAGEVEPDMDQINTGYKIASKYQVDWKPLAVFDDGLKTYIRMPVRISEAPVLYIILDKKETLVNYRVKGRYYIVDRLFDRAYLKVASRSVVIARNPVITQRNANQLDLETQERKKSDR